MRELIDRRPRRRTPGRPAVQLRVVGAGCEASSGRPRCAGRAESLAHGRARIAATLPLLVDGRDEEDLVVHGEPEHDGEDHHRDDGGDRPWLDADQAAPAAMLEDRDGDTERGGDREQR